MDLEKNRIPTKFRHPFIPVRNSGMLVTLPSTGKCGNRKAGTVVGWALHTLGVSATNLSGNTTVEKAVAAHLGGDVNVPSGMFASAAGKKLREGYAIIKKDLVRNRHFLNGAFGEAKVKTLTNAVEDVLDQYTLEDKKAARRR